MDQTAQHYKATDSDGNVRIEINGPQSEVVVRSENKPLGKAAKVLLTDQSDKPTIEMDGHHGNIQLYDGYYRVHENNSTGPLRAQLGEGGTLTLNGDDTIPGQVTLTHDSDNRSLRISSKEGFSMKDENRKRVLEIFPDGSIVLEDGNGRRLTIYSNGTISGFNDSGERTIHLDSNTGDIKYTGNLIKV